MKLPPDQIEPFVSAVHNAAGRADVRRAVENVYAAVGDAIDLRQPRCSASGRCCRFDEYGHRLFVTTMELATFVHEQGEEGIGEDGGGCRFQVGGLCSVHAIRPFGCRIFYCDPSATDWQQEQYARFHAELKRLHERLDVPYFYVEWRQALAAVGWL